jgi:trimeric autotransporter adhesin
MKHLYLLLLALACHFASYAAIMGPTSLCVGGTATYSSTSVASGTWSSSIPAVGTIDASTGYFTGLSAGTTTITFTSASTSTLVVTVSAPPPPISGTLHGCVGGTATLTDAASGGTWSDAAWTSYATIGSTTGIVTGLSPGTAIITYSLSAGCSTTAVFTINPLPGLIISSVGPSVCPGQSATLSSTPGGGIWSSAASGISVGSTTGVVSGIAAGAAVISYTIPATGCYRTYSFTVNPLPAPIVGPTHICVGDTVTLTDASGGGLWSSSNTSISYFSSSAGTMIGMAYGRDTVYYTFTATGCNQSVSVLVDTACATLGTATHAAAESEVRIYPNPATDALTILCNPGNYNTAIVVDNLGQQLITTSITSNKTALNIKSLPAGMYFISLRGPAGNAGYKMLKE